MGDGSKSFESQLSGAPPFSDGCRMILTVVNDDGETYRVWDGNRLVNIDIPDEARPIYKCSYCFQSFRGSSALGKHLKIHPMEGITSFIQRLKNTGAEEVPVPSGSTEEVAVQSYSDGIEDAEEPPDDEGDPKPEMNPFRTQRRTRGRPPIANKRGRSVKESKSLKPKDPFTVQQSRLKKGRRKIIPPETGPNRVIGRTRSGLNLKNLKTEEYVQSDHDSSDSESDDGIGDADKTQNDEDASNQPNPKIIPETTSGRKHPRAPSKTTKPSQVESQTDQVNSKPKRVSGKTGNLKSGPNRRTPSKPGKEIDIGQSRPTPSVSTASPTGNPGISENIEIIQSNGQGETPKKQFRCKLCLAVLTARANAARHIRLVHLKEKAHQCSICSKSYSAKRTLDVHMNYHNGIKQYQCDLCPSEFYQSIHLKRHLLVHSGTRPHKCHLCDKSYFIRYELTNHLRKSHGESN